MNCHACMLKMAFCTSFSCAHSINILGSCRLSTFSWVGLSAQSLFADPSHEHELAEATRAPVARILEHILGQLLQSSLVLPSLWLHKYQCSRPLQLSLAVWSDFHSIWFSTSGMFLLSKVGYRDRVVVHMINLEDTLLILDNRHGDI